MELFRFPKPTKNRMIQAALLVSVIALVCGLGVLIGLVNPIYVVLLSLFLYLVIFLRGFSTRLYLSPILILAISGFVPFGISVGSGSRLVAGLLITIAIIGIWLIKMLIFDRQFVLVKSPINIPVFGFVTTIFISLIWSTIFRDPNVYVWDSFYYVQIGAALVMAISPLVLILLVNFINDQRHIRLLKILSYLMIAIGVIGIFQNFFSFSLSVNVEGLARLWIVGLAFAFILFDRNLSTIWRFLFIVLIWGWIVYSFILGFSWIAGWLPILISVGLITFLRSKWLAAVLLIVVFIYGFFSMDRLQDDFSTESVVSGQTRLSAWAVNWKYTQQHWLLGMGPAGYVVYYMTFNPDDAMATHSNYLDMISQTGFVGLGFYLAIFGVLGWRGLVVYRRVRGRRDFSEALIVALLGGWAGCMVIMAFGDWLIPFAYTQTISGFRYTVYSWIFLGAILSMDQITAPTEQPVDGMR